MIVKRNKYYYVAKVQQDRVDPIVKLYPSIDQALSSFIGQTLTGMILYVYEVTPRQESLVKDPKIEDEPFRDVLGTSWYLTALPLRNPKKIIVGKVKEVKKVTNGWRGLKTTINMYDWKEEFPKTRIPKFYHIMTKDPVKEVFPSIIGALSETPGLVGFPIKIGIITEQPEILREEPSGKIILKKGVTLKEYKTVSPISMKRIGKIYLYEI